MLAYDRANNADEEDANFLITHQDNNFVGLYLFQSIEIELIENVEKSKYLEIDETKYIRIEKDVAGQYILITNIFFLQHFNAGRLNVRSPNESFYMFNQFREQFGEQFYLIAADGPEGSLHIAFFYKDSIITIFYRDEVLKILDIIERPEERPLLIYGEERELVQFKVFFQKYE